MRVTSIGGGPGGLYAALLLKLADPSHEVTVLERNAPDDTFGFGVVFSAATLRELEAADADSFQRLWDASARWDPVEVRYGGQHIRAHGNRFAAISRHRLLRILQERAKEVGVDLRFHTEVDELDAHLDEADLVLGADGINSLVRRRFEDVFCPQLTREGSKFIWLGTTQRFDAFTFIFEAAEAGTFQAHIYPFSEDLSTFIVECTEDTWRAAGLDAIDPASLAPGESDHASITRLQELFADHLDGHGLVANNSKWLDWTTVRNATWHHRNVVLLGDAAHTAHFSIGSGTKLALEDAIALADALATEPDLEAALKAYESARKPSADGIQRAAAESLDWFARYRRYWGFEPPQFTYSLLTRSSRVDYENTRRRDPELVHQLDRWFAGHASGAEAGSLLAPPPPAFTALPVGRVTLPNRLALLIRAEPAGTDGRPSRELLTELQQSARAGAGLVLVDGVAVGADARRTPTDAGLYDDDHETTWRQAVDAFRETAPDARLGLRVRHAGPRGAAAPRTAGSDLPLPPPRAWPLVAASDSTYSPVGQPATALDEPGMVAIRDAFMAAAERAARAGIDALELHAAHGELLASFLSPLTNRRDDAYGGDVHGRLRFPLEVLDAVRAVWPEDRLLSVVFSASDLQPRGLTADDARTIARELRAHGADLLHVVAGQTTPRSRPEYGTGFNSRWSDLVRNEAGGPVITSGHLPTIGDVNHVLMAGRADACVLGLPLLPSPAWLMTEAHVPALTRC
ncbi:FAD-dependent monooxygenase [Nitriliruptor alkaliphilus]|uniref:oxidoreductase n=1 Tax=Nitriliruptor alkaliphilus TaxID=427918 RepID=UPI0006962DFB|nr:FAD-dependent monooxygenase [Nitriliruptor alkaliphilus]